MIHLLEGEGQGKRR